MSGISSKAAGIIQNKEKTFQGQRFDDDLELNCVQFKWRNYDPQIGRFIEIDPLSEKYVYNSTYAFSENKVIGHVELEGLEAVPTEDKRPKQTKGNNISFNPFAPLFYMGVASIQAANVRTQYNIDAAKLSPNDKQSRVDLKEKTRANTPEPYKSIVEKARPIAGEQVKVTDPNFKGNATKTNIEVNETMKTTGVWGKVFLITGVVQSSITISTSNNPVKEAVTEGAGWAGAIYGGGQAAIWAAPAGPVASAAAGFLGSAAGFFFGKTGADAVTNALPVIANGAGSLLNEKAIVFHLPH